MNKRKMLITAFSILGIFILGVIAIGVFSKKSTTGIAYRSIKIQNVDGDANILRNEKKMEPYNNMALRSGDTVEVLESSSLIFKLDEDKYVKVSENTTVKLESETNKQNSKTRLVVLNGGIIVDVKQKLEENEDFEVNTANSSMAIRGTLFAVNVSSENDKFDISYSLFEGKGEIDIYSLNNDKIETAKTYLLPSKKIEFSVDKNDVIDASSIKDIENNKKVNYLGEFKLEEIKNHLTNIEFSDVTNISNEENDKVCDAFLEFGDDSKSISVSMANATIYKNNEVVASDVTKYSSSDNYLVHVELANDIYLNPLWSVNNEVYFVDGKPFRGNEVDIEVSENMIIYPYQEENYINLNVNNAKIEKVIINENVEDSVLDDESYNYIDSYTAIIKVELASNMEVDYWLINNVKYYKDDALVTDSEINLLIDENTCIDVVLKEKDNNGDIDSGIEPDVNNPNGETPTTPDVDNNEGNPTPNEGENNTTTQASIKLDTIGAVFFVTGDENYHTTYESNQSFTVTVIATDVATKTLKHWLINGNIYMVDNNVVTVEEISVTIDSNTTIEAVYNVYGNGTISSPYMISSATDFMAIKEINKTQNDAYYIQNEDIDLTNYEVESIGDSLCAFTGNYNGNNRKIIGLHMKDNSNDALVGLFGYIRGNISNLIIENAYVEAANSYLVF